MLRRGCLLRLAPPNLPIQRESADPFLRMDVKMATHEKGKSLRVWSAIMTWRLSLGLVVVSVCAPSTATAQTIASLFPPDDTAALRQHVGSPPPAHAQPAASQPPKRANFEKELGSQASRAMADWVVDSGDNHLKPFVIVDKTQAKVFVFDA